MSGSNVCASFMLTEPLPVTASAWSSIKAAVPVTDKIGVRSGDVSLGQMEHARHAAMRATVPSPGARCPAE